MKRILLCFVFLYAVNNLYAQWVHTSYLINSVDTYVSNVVFTSPNGGYYSDYFIPEESEHYCEYDIYRTDDGWQTFTWVNGGGGNYEAAANIGDLIFLNDSVGYKLVFGIFPYIKKTVDKGHTWSDVPHNVSLYDIYHISYPAEDVGYYLSSPAQIIASYEGDCHLLDFPGEYYGFANISFINDSTGFVFCRDTLNNYVCIRTSDSARTWTGVLNQPNGQFRGIHFPSNNVGYMIAPGGLMYKTTNTGKNWQILPTGVTRNLNSVYFINDSIGYIAGDSGLIMSTNNGGSSWSSEAAGTTFNIKKIYLSDTSNGFFYAGASIFRKSSTGILDTVTGLYAVVTGNYVHLEWTAPSSGGVLGYNVYRNDTLLTTTPVIIPIYDDSLVPNGLQTYCVSAVYGTGESDTVCTDAMITYSIPEEEASVRIYPNPADEVIKIVSPVNFSHIRILNLLGQEVYQYSAPCNNLRILTTGIQAGLYVLQFTLENSTIVRRISIK
ncbi:MAG: YCF48-related protein [Bacteroidetes bacterium]|nr:YCF48-related protein [Bacteroidota bacterium]